MFLHLDRPKEKFVLTSARTAWKQLCGESHENNQLALKPGQRKGGCCSLGGARVGVAGPSNAVGHEDPMPVTRKVLWATGELEGQPVRRPQPAYAGDSGGHRAQSPPAFPLPHGSVFFAVLITLS